MKLNQLKEEIRSIIKERSVNSIRKAQDKNFKDIEIALDAYKKAKAEGKDLKKFVDILKKLGNDKKSLEKELFGAVSGLYKDAEYQEESVNEGLKHLIHVETPKEITSKNVVNQITALAKKGVRSYEIGLNMGFMGNQKSAVDAFQKVKNKIYFDLHKNESVNEGKKAFKVNPGIGKAKYSISSHDGKKKHNDGSDFWDIEIFKNKVDLEKGIKKYTSNGFVKESVNEASFVKGKTYGGTKCEGGCYVGKQGLMKLIKISKDNPENVFMFRDDNYSGIQPHFIKNGVIAIAKTINPSYDLERNKVRNLKIGNDVILSVRLFESVNESIDEATTSWSRMMQDVRKGGSGPWSLVGIENKKVVAQKNNIKDKNLLPAHFEAMRRENPKAKIHIEDAGGQVVWNEKK